MAKIAPSASIVYQFLVFFCPFPWKLSDLIFQSVVRFQLKLREMASRNLLESRRSRFVSCVKNIGSKTKPPATKRQIGFPTRRRRSWTSDVVGVMMEVVLEMVVEVFVVIMVEMIVAKPVAAKRQICFPLVWNQTKLLLTSFINTSCTANKNYCWNQMLPGSWENRELCCVAISYKCNFKWCVIYILQRQGCRWPGGVRGARCCLAEASRAHGGNNWVLSNSHLLTATLLTVVQSCRQDC